MGALFFTDSTMHKIYEDKGKYNFLYQLPIIIWPILISNILREILKYFSLYEDKIAKIVNDNNKNNGKKKKKLIIYYNIQKQDLLLFLYY